MKNIFTAVTLLLVLASCSTGSNYTITGSIDGAIEGDSVTLGYSVDGVNFVTESKTAIENGEFIFKGTVDGCKIYYIGYDNAIEPTYTLFFLEEGNINVEVSAEASIVSGTPANDLNAEVENHLAQYVNRLYEYQFRIYSDTLMTDSTRSAINIQATEIQRNASLYIQDVIRENINSIVSMFLLVQYSDLFDDDELAQLIDRIPKRHIDRENNCLYDILKEIQADREDSHHNEESDESNPYAIFSDTVIE